MGFEQVSLFSEWMRWLRLQTLKRDGSTKKKDYEINTLTSFQNYMCTYLSQALICSALEFEFARPTRALLASDTLQRSAVVFSKIIFAA
mmetsp:Transcript_8727/g.11568  ORF Transcript_8727/g.11568 Transcript_8727/m.11568 type:complete len:89 (-) Transcript_8727:83-349(-)